MARGNRVKRHVARMYEEQGGKCYYCGTTMFVGMSDTDSKKHLLATFDHIVPRSHGGTYAKANGVCACKRCNTIRGNMDFEYFKETWAEHHAAYRKRMATKSQQASSRNMNKAKNSFIIAWFAENIGLPVREALIATGVDESLLVTHD